MELQRLVDLGEPFGPVGGAAAVAWPLAANAQRPGKLWRVGSRFAAGCIGIEPLRWIYSRYA